MRVPTDMPPRRRRRGSSRGRPALIITVVILIFLFISARGIAGFYTDFLWFDQLGFGSVFTGLFWTKVFLAVIFTLLMFALLFVNLVVADRLAPKFRPLGPEDELVQRYRQIVGRHAGKVRLAVAVIFALILGTGQSKQWNTWILFRNATSFHSVDAQFHKDVSFFVFRLPFYQFLVSWSFGAVVVVTFLTAIFHYLNGGIRLQTQGQRVSPQVKAHLSVLLGLLALIKAVGYWFQRYQLDFSTRGPVKGATYTDVHAQLPAYNLLILIMVLAFVLFVVNIRLRGWTLPVLAIGLWMLVSVAVGAIYPLIIEQAKVKPSENRREQPYIARNIAATRQAFNLNNVKVTAFPYDSTALTPNDLVTNAQTIRNVRLWDPALTLGTYQQEQELKQYYTMNDIDIDRYTLGGNETQTILSVRELNQADLPQNSWVNQHLQFTHGYGAVLAATNAVTPDGLPVFDLAKIPPTVPPGAPPGTPTLDPKRTGVYFGEVTSNFSIVDSKQPELDYQNPDGSNVSSQYSGSGGVELSSLLRRLAFTARFGDPNILISGQIDTHSRILYVRTVAARVHKAAPFLKLDADPYAVILPNGRLVWVQDAYTTTDKFPYAQDANVDRLAGNSGLKTNFNYVRNSVKAVVDAYDGSTTLYVQDPTDPILRAYQKAFPKLFRPASDMPAGLTAHLRYPEDMFMTQTTAYGRYHITDPQAFYANNDAWNVAQDPGTGNASLKLAQTVQTTPNGQPIAGTAQSPRQPPYYLVTKLPDETREEFQILQPFVPQSSDDKQQNLSAFMVAKSGDITDPTTGLSDYGQLEVFRMPAGTLVDGPAQINSLISQNPTVSRDISLLNTNGSEADFGNVLTIPIENSLLYIRPLYVKSTRTNNPIPVFEKAIVVFNNQVAYENTLQQALDDLFPGTPNITQELGTAAPTTPTTPGTTPTPTTPQATTVANLLAQAQADFTAANAALKNGDLATYQQQTNAGESLIAQAATQLQSGSTSTPGTTTTTVAGASAPTTTTTPASPPSSA